MTDTELTGLELKTAVEEKITWDAIKLEQMPEDKPIWVNRACPPVCKGNVISASQPYKCPCCDGWKQRFRGNGSFLGTTEDGEWVDCPACNATGVIWR